MYRRKKRLINTGCIENGVKLVSSRFGSSKNVDFSVDFGCVLGYTEFLKKGTKIRLEKEPDNEYDKEAIKVIYEGLGKIGYVANSSYTVLGDSMSAGRIYDKIGKKAKVVLVTEHGTICSISKKSLLDNQKKVKKSETEVEE